MNELTSLTKNDPNLDSIVRSLKDGPDYKPHWRYLVCGQHLNQTKDSEAALNDILSEEKDPYIRQLLLFQSGRRSVIRAAIEWSLGCHLSRNKNLTATMISAMVIAGRDPSDIADEIGTTCANVVAYEKLFFDARRYLDLNFWIKEVCYFPNRITLLPEPASRWLITASERGWDALAFTFRLSQWEPICKSAPDLRAKWSCDRTLLGVAARLGDFVSGLEMSGVAPTAEEVEPLMKIGFFAREMAPVIATLEYPPARSPRKQKEHKKSAELVNRLSGQRRRKITGFLDRVKANATNHPDPEVRREFQDLINRAGENADQMDIGKAGDQ